MFKCAFITYTEEQIMAVQEGKRSKQFYHNSSYLPKIQPKSLKSIQENVHPITPSASYSSVTQLVTEAGSSDSISSAAYKCTPKPSFKYVGILLTLLASFLFSIAVLKTQQK